MNEYKYQKQIDALIGEGYIFPKVNQPNNKSAFRFVFAEKTDKNHLPVCISNPKRILPGPVKFSGYALSCFGCEEHALMRYNALKNSFKNIAVAIGDSIASGNITNDDGMVTEEEKKTSHFDLYEFNACNLHKTFTIKKKLI